MKHLKIYLAGRYERKQELKKYSHTLIAMGHVVTSRWIDMPDIPFDESKHQQMREEAAIDLADIDYADTVIVFSEGKGKCSPGRNIETGYAMAKGKVVMLVGPRESVFHYLINWCPDFQHLLSQLPKNE